MEIFMLEFIWTFNSSVFILFTLLYIHQIIYTVVSLVTKPKKFSDTDKTKHYAFIIAARDESGVIEGLLDSIKKQSYPTELIDTIVIADNCTDNTAKIAAQYGARVFERFNKNQIGKGYAMDFAFKRMISDGTISNYDGFFIMDADNILHHSFVSEMDKVFSAGYSVVTGYRNSKNFGDNWITMGYSTWFIRESTYLNKPRMILGTNCMVSGTGYLISREIVEKSGGWGCFLLTEDIEFNAKCILDNYNTGYCHDAIFYDEQPTSFKTSWNQRMRWMRGTYQVLWRYGINLFLKLFTGRMLPKFDMLMSMVPAIFFTLASVLVNLTCFVLAAFKIFSDIGVMGVTLKSLLMALVNFYLAFLGIGTLAIITDWKRIKAAWHKKILSVFAFPLFILTYIPISVAALFKPVDWTPVKHTVITTAEELNEKI